jgi:D-glycero-D-manno-heptose 1,7-bisphosphate phosphatase
VSGQHPRAAVFLDRDGVINRDSGYTHRVEDFELLPGVVEELLRMQQLGFRLIVVTNQAGIARGFYTENDYAVFTGHMRAELVRSGVTLDAVYHCPHHTEGSIAELAVACECRKPAPGMLLRGIGEFGLDAKRCWLVGDKLSDVDAGKAAGLPDAQCVLLRHNSGLSGVSNRIEIHHCRASS